MKQNISFYILIVLALAALGVLIWLLAPGSAPDTPPVHLSPAAAPEEDAVQPTAMPAAGTVLEVTPETVQAVIAAISRADSYFRTLTVQNFWNGGNATAEIDVWVRGEEARLTIRGGGAAREKNILIRGGEEWLWYTGSGSVWHGAARPGDTDVWQTIPTYEDVLALDPADILDAGYLDYNGEGCVFVRVSGGALDYESLYYISDSSGLLMGAEIYDGRFLVYAMRSSQPDISTPDESLFQAPL